MSALLTCLICAVIGYLIAGGIGALVGVLIGLALVYLA
jgi:hypothetical protein